MIFDENEDGLAGKLLIAMPGIDDARFERTVILLCAHNEEHAMGIVLNRTSENLTLSELLDQLEVPIESELSEDTVLAGGPVGKDRGFVIHSEDFESVGATIPIREGLRLTATKEILHAIASDDRPRRCRLALGYSGWGPLQLEEELKQNVWLVADSDDEIVFDMDFEGKWERAISKLGISPAMLQSGPVGNA